MKKGGGREGNKKGRGERGEMRKTREGGRGGTNGILKTHFMKLRACKKKAKT